MNKETIRIVQSSFSKIAPIADQAAEIFYSRLFELDPTLQVLFKGDMKNQGKKLMSMIGTAVGALSNPDILIPVVQKLGKDHKGYGVTAEMYDTVGSSLMYTLEAGLGEDFTSSVQDAWTDVYVLLSTTMKESAAEVDS